MPLTRPVAWPLLCTLAVVPVLALLAPVACADAGGGPLTPEDLVMLRRVSDPQVAPDGRTLAFVERETDMAANRGRNAVWLLELGRAEAAPQRLTELKDNASSPRWAPDGRTLYFLSSQSGSAQIWRVTPGTAAEPGAGSAAATSDADTNREESSRRMVMRSSCREGASEPKP